MRSSANPEKYFPAVNQENIRKASSARSKRNDCLVRKYERLDSSFYQRETLEVAPELLGCLLRHETGNGTTSGIIVETEAYLGDRDGASHARFGITPRSRIMYGKPGTAYVYFVYGMHYLLNAVTEPEGKAGAVLIRACEPFEGLDLMETRRGKSGGRELMSGPGKVCQAMEITKTHNGTDLTEGELGIYLPLEPALFEIEATGRIGVAGWAEKPFRFIIKNNLYISG
ncbi:MAG: DNA-3-methyladenine glycosylase [Actinobacteria bacterium]|nr:DNA-3-methyladenine glycosylase [Actinomycetota bacterium]